MSIEEIREEIKSLESQIAALQKQKLSWAERLANDTAAHKPGDRVRMYGKEYVVSRFCPGRYNYETVRYYGHMIKKDGTPGEREFELYSTIEPVEVQL